MLRSAHASVGDGMRTPTVGWLWAVVAAVAGAFAGCADDGAAGDIEPSDATVTQDQGQPADAGPGRDDQGHPRDARLPELDAAVDAAPARDAAPVVEPESSPRFLEYARPEAVPGRFPASPCDGLTEHHLCATTPGCGWLRTIKDDGLCRADPVTRCLDSGECACAAVDFHGEEALDDALELFLPLSVTPRNLAPRTSAFGGRADRYAVEQALEPIVHESLQNFTSRTDFTVRRLNVRALAPVELAGGLTVTLKFMPVWDSPAAMSGVLLEGLGVRVVLDADQVQAEVGDGVQRIGGEDPVTGGAKDYQCNALALVVPLEGEATVWLGEVATPIPGLDRAAVQAALQAEPERLLGLGPASVKLWDVRVYDRPLTPAQLAEIGKRCGPAGAYPIPAGYPESNERYSWGMGGSRVVPHHAAGDFSSGVYVTLRMPEGEHLPQPSTADREALKRMVGFWDRWHEQMYFELDFIPFVDNRALEPAGSLNSYRAYPENTCQGAGCGEQANGDNPCRHVTDLIQAINWLPEDWPEEPTSADHRKVAQRGGWTRWDAHDPDRYQSWTRPVHEHGHTTHFTLMRTYDKVHHYLRGIAGEAFAEVMAQYVLTGTAPWMLQGLTYYPSIPLAFEGRWDAALERHVFKSPQPYQARNIGDQGLGARFYGMGLWWTFVSHFAGKPYLVGRIAGDSDLTPGSVLQWARFYLAQEGLDLGELYGNFVAHTATWDWPQIGHFLHAIEQEPFQDIARWCTENSGPDCTVDGLKTHVDLPTAGTDGAWVFAPLDRLPGGFASNTIRIAGAPGGAIYAISLSFDVPDTLFPDTGYHVGLRTVCRDDPRFFASRIVVAQAGTEGQAQRPRPQYYKIPGRFVDEVVIQVPEGPAANVYVLAIPTPPFELEDVRPFVDSTSLTWPYRYKITRLDAVPEGAEVTAPIVLEGDQTLGLEVHDGNGFTFDCFAD